MNIAGLGVQLGLKDMVKRNKKLACFAVRELQKTDLSVSFENNHPIPIPENTLLLDDKMLWNCKDDKEENIEIYIKEQDIDKAAYRLRVNRSWNKALITCETGKDAISPFLGSFGEIVFRNRILYHQGIVIHAAAIEWNKKGLLFSAPSGTGKTTQANLWRKYKGAKIINADRPSVRLIQDQPYVYGTLWNGSSKKCRNQAVPLAAIILLEQAKENTILKLSQAEAVKRLMPRCFLPYYQKELMELAMDNLEKLIRVTPVYYLRCRPDKEAVEFVYQCVK